VAPIFFKRIQYYSSRELVAQGEALYAEYINTLRIPVEDPEEKKKKIKYYEKLLPVRTVAVLNYPVTSELYSGDNIVSNHIVVNEDNNMPTFDLMDWTIIELTKFQKDVDQLETDLDRWLYFLKMSKYEMPVDERLWQGNDAIKSAYGRLLTMTPEEKRAYERAKQHELDHDNILTAAEEKAAAEEKGRQEEKLLTAKNLLNKGMDVDSIVEVTGLDSKTVEQLRRDLPEPKE